MPRSVSLDDPRSNKPVDDEHLDGAIAADLGMLSAFATSRWLVCVLRQKLSLKWTSLKKSKLDVSLLSGSQQHLLVVS